MALQILLVIVQAAVVLSLPPLLVGVILKTKAWFAGRVGPPVLQVYYDLFKLLNKGAVYSTTTTWVFRAGPIVSLAALITAAMIVPVISERSWLGFRGDII